MPVPLSARTTTDRPAGAAFCWIAMGVSAYMRLVTVPDGPESVQPGSNPFRLSGWGVPARGRS